MILADVSQHRLFVRLSSCEHFYTKSFRRLLSIRSISFTCLMPNLILLVSKLPLSAMPQKLRCADGYYGYGYGACSDNRSDWYIWGRWVLLALILLTAVLAYVIIT